MSNRKATPAPFVQRSDALSSSFPAHTHGEADYFVPQTPRYKVRTKRGSKIHRTPHETYMEANARGITDENKDPNERISHDLSLTDNARHSVVDNMLMSLNPDQPRLFSSSKDLPPPFSSGSDSTTYSSGPHRRLHSSPYNSDFSSPSDDSPNRQSNHLPRGRRSNSSSNFQSPLSRINSVHLDGEALDNTQEEKIHRGQRAENGSGNPLHARRKSSKGSIGSNLDMGQTTGQPLFSQTLSRRSASFDNSPRRQDLYSGSNPGTQPQFPGSTSQPVEFDDSEAAPTPTIPGGPRKDRSTSSQPQQTQAAGSATTPPSKNINKSSKGRTVKKKKGEAMITEAAASPSPQVYGASRRDSKLMAPVPPLVRSRNSSPARQFSEPSIAHGPDQSTKAAARERPGFFRRVFGSSRGQASTSSDLNTHQIQQPRTNTRAASRERSANPQKPARPPINDDVYLPEGVQGPPSKKPSMFFRRRKKSVSEPMPPPLLPVQNNLQGTRNRQHSPVSSLRQVMNPFLDNPLHADVRQFAGTTNYQGASMQTTTLQAKGSVDPLNYSPDPRVDAGFNNPLRQPRELPSPKPGIPTERLHLKPTDRPPPKSQDSSFLHDDSSNESRIFGVPEDSPLSRHDTVRLDEAPTSVPADMRLRKDISAPHTTPGVAVEPRSSHSEGSPRNRNVLGNRSTNVPTSPRPSNATPAKSEAREWLTDSHQQTPQSLTRDPERLRLEPRRPVEGDCKNEATSKERDAEAPHNDIHIPEPPDGIILDDDANEPTDRPRSQAKQIYDGDESFVAKSMAAAWLGEPDLERKLIRQVYMELFDWQGLNILTALRGLCSKLYLKGESQQIDRILDTFSTRWCACNPSHGFKATDVVHTICYSVLLLNTDLHQADIETKMTRTQFLKNILPTIRRVVMDAAPDAFTNARASTVPLQKILAESSRQSFVPSSPATHDLHEGRRSFEGQRPIYRLSQRPSDQTAYTSTPSTPHTPLDFNSSLGDCGPLVKNPFHGRLSTWENQIELVLKDFYSSIRQQPLPLYGTEPKEVAQATPQQSYSLTTVANNVLRRTPSTLSKAGSENFNYSRSRQHSEQRLGTGRWQSKNRSRPHLFPASTVASSRRSSFDEQSSMTSPSVMSVWSKFSSLGRTQTPMSLESLSSHYPLGDYQQSIGFANALSQAIIREEGMLGEEEPLRAAPMLEDESLELSGAPWAKEGMLKHKHQKETVDRRAKDRNWVESFAVIEKGYLRLFSFNMNAKSLRQKASRQKAAGGVVGGGNWADSAETLGTFLLRQTIASALPPPGYSKSRPHVWSLSLPTGAVHFFQAGTPEIVNEFVETANYWSARLSKEPMVGGISNIEYGWSESVINTAIMNVDRNLSTSAVGVSGPRPSLQSSIRSTRSSIDPASVRPRLPGDKIMISEWTPPQQSMVASVLMEVDQLTALSTYVQNIEEDLQKHNELRAAMSLAFTTRHPNGTKAMTNWERKSAYLLQEIVKFRIYIDSLKAAQVQKEKIYAERAERENEAPATGDAAKVVETAEEDERREVDASTSRTMNRDIV